MDSLPFYIHDLFRTCRSVILPKARNKGITLYLCAEPMRGKKLLGDLALLRQAVLNILSSALKFSNAGAVTLMCAVEQQDNNTARLRFEVKYSGVVLSPQEIYAGFEHFTQAVIVDAEAGRGYTITQNILDTMHSEMYFDTTHGKENKFGFVITLNTVDAIDPARTTEILQEDAERPVFAGNVLVCEDSAINQLVMREYLSGVCLSVTAASNGEEGLAAVEQRMTRNEAPFDLIFMDIHMPVMDGIETTKKLIDMGCSSPIIALTANVTAEDIAQYRLNGIVDFLAKPFTTSGVWRHLFHYLTLINFEQIDTRAVDEADERRRRRIMVDFATNYRDAARNIAAAAEQGNVKRAKIIAHTLKGLAGLLGKDALLSAVRVIEHSFDESEDGVAEYKPSDMETLERELGAVVDEITPLIEDFVEKKENSLPLVREKASALFDKLAALLETDSVECIAMAQELRKIPGTKELVLQMEDYEFEQALKTLAMVRRNLEV